MFIPTLPVPFGVIDISLFAPSSMTIVPEFEPPFVLRVKSPVPCVVRTTFWLAFPSWVVMAFNLIRLPPLPASSALMYILASAVN